MREGWVVEECSRFTLPSIPSSINALYQISFAQRKVFMNPEARLWKTQMKLLVPRIKTSETTHFFKIDRKYYYPFFYKNGKVKKVDTHNLDKLLIDTISEKCGFDDSLVKFGDTESYNDINERVEIVISKVFEEEPPSAVA
jgi:Holliday junction resolvase RusA-like endonuclease